MEDESSSTELINTVLQVVEIDKVLIGKLELVVDNLHSFHKVQMIEEQYYKQLDYIDEVLVQLRHHYNLKMTNKNFTIIK